MRPLVAFLVTFALALVVTGVTAARTRTFQSANCNTATPQPTAGMTRDGQMNYAIVAAWDGYQWGGGCWNNDDHDAAPNDPPQQFTGGEGGDCSGFTFKTWRESQDSGNAGRYYWAPLRNVHGPYTAEAFKNAVGAPNGTIYKPNADAMDGFASTWHVGLVFFRGSGGWDQVIEAKCEACGTNLFDETYRSQSAFGGIRRIGWTG